MISAPNGKAGPVEVPTFSSLACLFAVPLCRAARHPAQRKDENADRRGSEESEGEGTSVSSGHELRRHVVGRFEARSMDVAWWGSLRAQL